MAPLRVVHLSVMRSLSGGQRKQLVQESRIAATLHDVEWDTVAVHDEEPVLEFEVRTPRLLRWHALRSAYGWWVARRLSRRYDFVLMRHAPFDAAGALLSHLVDNRVPVHHSKEVEELPLIRPGRVGRFLARVERTVGGMLIRRSAAVLGVTREIAEYEVARAGCPDKPRDIFPNTIVVESVAPAGDERAPDQVNAAFVCGRFNAWHGLDLLVEDAARAGVGGRLRIHLIGTLSQGQLAAVSAFPDLFLVHGHLKEAEYRRILAQCDVGIGSLALARQNLSEGSTLKMCETLAMGLPVYAGSPDVVLPPQFAYCRVDPVPSLERLAAFGAEMKGVSRAQVREAAGGFINKEDWMRRAAGFLRGPGVGRAAAHSR